MWHHISQECRGIIVDKNQNWDIISFPFLKFFNYGKPITHQIDWDSAKIYEKVDGSIMTMYYYDNRWNVASSGILDASGHLPIRHNCSDELKKLGLKTFADLFWHIWNKKN